MYMKNYKVDRSRWAKMTIFEQMGNIGSEVGRTLKAQRAGEDFEPALTRALDLFDATSEALLQAKSPRLKEVLRSKDQFLAAVYQKPDPKIEDYFNQFAIAARLHR
jgi:hypothetical protein